MAKKAQRVVETLDSIILPDDDHENDNDNDEEPMDNGDGFDFTGGGDDNNDDDDMFANMNDGGDDMYVMKLVTFFLIMCRNNCLNKTVIDSCCL